MSSPPAPPSIWLKHVLSDGRRNIAGQVGLGTAVDDPPSWGLDAIRDRVAELAAGPRRRPGAVPGVTVRDRGAEQCGLVSFTADKPSTFRTPRASSVRARRTICQAVTAPATSSRPPPAAGPGTPPPPPRAPCDAGRTCPDGTAPTAAGPGSARGPGAAGCPRPAPPRTGSAAPGPSPAPCRRSSPPRRAGAGPAPPAAAARRVQVDGVGPEGDGRLVGGPPVPGDQVTTSAHLAARRHAALRASV